MVKRDTDKHSYFNKIAEDRISYRKKHKYYWNYLTKNCDFFIHESNSVLEIGCGTGELIAQVKGIRKTGIDFSEVMIKKAREQYPDIDFKCMDAHSMELHETYDVIIISNLIGWLDDVQLCFQKIRKHCHPRTRIILTYYNFLWEPLIKLAEFLHIKKKSPEQNWLSQKDIHNLLYHCDLEVYRRKRNMLMPVYIPVLSWFLNKYIAHLPFFNLLTLNQHVFARPVKPVDSKKYTVSIVIPARNESGNIENAIKRLPEFGGGLEIIYVEGNSTDDTWEKIQEVQKKYAGEKNIVIARQEGKGKADAVRKGYSIATGDILMILDADLTVPPETLPKFYEAIVTGKGEFINGSRLVYPLGKNSMRFLNMLGNKFFSHAFTYLLEQPIKDTLCGTKVMFREDYIRLVSNRKFFGDFDPFGDFDLLFGAYKLNLKIIDLPIRYQERTYGDTNISRFRHGFILLKMWFYAAGKIKFW
jgi:SAM-dependent methyltransferase